MDPDCKTEFVHKWDRIMRISERGNASIGDLCLATDPVRDNTFLFSFCIASGSSHNSTDGCQREQLTPPKLPSQCQRQRSSDSTSLPSPNVPRKKKLVPARLTSAPLCNRVFAELAPRAPFHEERCTASVLESCFFISIQRNSILSAMYRALLAAATLAL